MKKLTVFFSSIVLAFSFVACNVQQDVQPKTICNPLNISYRFQIDEPSRREAADPCIIRFQDKYILFASMSGGYWYSSDLTDWNFVETDQIPTEEYAPTAIALGDTLYFLASSNEKSSIYKSTDPFSGKWSLACEALEMPVWDPAFLLDEQRLYLYWGCSDVNPIYGVELDYGNNFEFIGAPRKLLAADKLNHGWEVPGDYNSNYDQDPWIEGAWLNKINGKYYLQYAGPGTEYKSYCDGVYVADHPLGPYKIQEHNPFAYKPEGFAAGAGHGNTFKDAYDNFWHIGTATISQKHIFERRLALFPTFVDEEGVLYTDTRFGDYPFEIPTHKIQSKADVFPDWMLLSYNKNVEVSSSIDGLPASNMVNEDIRTYWSAQSGDSGEFALLDLGANYHVRAVQVNFAEHDTHIFGRKKGIKHRYVIESSADKLSWNVVDDQSENNNDRTHVYKALDDGLNCRYLKITNVEVPDGNFAMSGFRVFGKGNGALPEKVTNIAIERHPEKRRSVVLKWNKSTNAVGYNVLFGSSEDKLYQCYTVYNDSLVEINSLNAKQHYWFAIEAFNENGIAEKSLKVKVD